MGAKSPNRHQEAPHGDSSSTKPADPDHNGGGRGSRSGDRDRTLLEDGGDNDDDDNGHNRGQAPNYGLMTSIPIKKKRKKRSKAKKTKPQQSSPPRTLLSSLYPQEDYPVGQLVLYDNLRRTTDEELRSVSRHWDDTFLKDYRHAAEIHRQVRQYVQQNVIKPGVKMSTIADEIDAGVRALCGHQGLEAGDPLIAGPAFPTGLSLNHVAAHWTPNPGGADPVLEESDVLSVDFGVHVNGRIVDSAFTVTHDPTFDNLLAAVRAATDTGLAVSSLPTLIERRDSDKANPAPSTRALTPPLPTSAPPSKK